MLIIKAITLWQPYASLVAKGAKQIETRSWATKYRGPLAIHAAKKHVALIPGNITASRIIQGVIHSQGISISKLPRGMVIATCNLVECVLITQEFSANLTDQELAFGDYSPGRYAWILEDVLQLEEPVQATGKQGLWNWEFNA